MMDDDEEMIYDIYQDWLERENSFITQVIISLLFGTASFVLSFSKSFVDLSSNLLGVLIIPVFFIFLLVVFGLSLMFYSESDYFQNKIEKIKQDAGEIA